MLIEELDTKIKTPNFDHQQITSAKTSMRIVPSTIKRVDWQPDTKNVDIGGGRYDDATHAMSKRGVVNLVFDPFNRSAGHNDAVYQELYDHPADTATINNVLNVIQEPDVREMVIDLAAQLIVKHGTAYFLIYAGDRSGEGRITCTVNGKAESWQNNMPASSYVDDIKQSFGVVKLSGNLITASQPF